jgi:hypothetical protein
MTAQISNAKIAEALRKTHGNFMLSAQMLKCSRVMIWSRVKKSEELQKIVEDERAGFVDVAEGALYSATLNGEAWAIQFTLRNLGRDRGYFEKQQQEITGKDGGPIKEEITLNVAEEVKKVAHLLPDVRQ